MSKKLKLAFHPEGWSLWSELRQFIWWVLLLLALH